MRTVSQLILIGALALPLQAQAPTAPTPFLPIDTIAYRRIKAIPAGAMSPGLSETMLGEELGGGMRSIHTGTTRDEVLGVSALGARWMQAADSTGAFYTSAGFHNQRCNVRCEFGVMAAMGFEQRIARFNGAASQVILSFDGQVGGGGSGKFTGWRYGGYAGAPITYSRRGDKRRLVAWTTPGFGITGPPGKSGSLHGMFGGGVGMYDLDRNVTVSAGVQTIRMRGADPVFGLAVGIGK